MVPSYWWNRFVYIIIFWFYWWRTGKERGLRDGSLEKWWGGGGGPKAKNKILQAKIKGKKFEQFLATEKRVINHKKIRATQESPTPLPPHHFSNGPSLIHHAIGTKNAEMEQTAKENFFSDGAYFVFSTNFYAADNSMDRPRTTLIIACLLPGIEYLIQTKYESGDSKSHTIYLRILIFKISTLWCRT